MSENYQYPIDASWSVEEMTKVIGFLQQVEIAYENPNGVLNSNFTEAYNEYRQVIPSKMEQKQIEKQFEKDSSYIPYQVIKLSKTGVKSIKL